MEISTFCVAFFATGIATILGGILLPSFRKHVMDYGSRGNTSENKAGDILQVPHTWFTHYYVVSVASSIFWGFQIITHGSAFRFLASHSQHTTVKSMTVNQVFLAWGFMALQGSRRLYESLTLTKPSQSKMSIAIWAIGVAYYIVMGISVWIEGISALNATESPLNSLEISMPSLKTLIATPIFIMASITQHKCHTYLAGLKKYTLPSHSLFRSIVSPHYTSECLVYVAITIVAAPKGQALNRTMLAGLCFVVTNLAVTANTTKKWYAEKFGADKLKGRWRMLPYVY